jgi:Ca-activated chloride channel family protein
MRALFARLEAPVMTDLAARFDGAAVELTPEPLPDVYRDEPLLLLMKTPKLTGELTLTGMVGGKRWTTTLSLDKAERGAGVAKLWARSRIDDAEVAAAVGAIAPDEADNRILTLALEHHLVSRVTSLVAVDKTPARAPGVPLARADVPLNVPAGWDFEKVFGKEKPVLERHAGLDAKLIAASATRIGQPAQPSSATVNLPEGGTLADLFLLIGTLLAALSALLFAFARRQAPV